MRTLARSLAVIGVGNMATAIVAGISASDIDISNIILFDKNEAQYEKLKDSYPEIFCGGLYATLIATFAIPVLFYGYQAILGETNAVINISIFFMSALVGMIGNYIFATRVKKDCGFIVLVIMLLILGFFIFTMYPPKGILFQAPFANVCGI